MISLSWSQTKTVADKLEPFVEAQGGVARAAQALGVKTYVVQKFCARRALTLMPEAHFETVVSKLGISTQGWDFG